MSQLVTITQAVTDQLNAADDLGQTFTAERVRIPLYETATTTTLKVFVLGLGEAIDIASRSEWQHDYTVKIAIYKRVDGPEDIDEMDQFREAVLDHFKSNRIVGDIAVLTAVQSDPIYDPAQLERFSVFVSVITLTYRQIQ